MPFPDALQEFRVATSGLSAQNGMHASASVNAVTKSGTNTFHGNAFEFLRHRALNSTSPFALIGPDGKRKNDGLLRNQFGGTAGGPIVRDRLFFFGAYQGTALRFRPADQIAFVPTRADARRRLHDGHLTRMHGRQADQSWRRLRQQPHQSGALQPGRDEPGPAPAGDDGSLRPDHVSDDGRQQ